jgi:hypothetical protein
MPRKRRDRRIYTLDAETDPFEFGAKIEPFVWGLYDGEIFRYFWGESQKECCDSLIDYLRDQVAEGEDIIVYAHNAGKFDFLFLYEYLDSELMLVNGRIAVAHLFDGKVELRDSFMIMPIALKEFDKDDIEYWKMKKEHRNNHKNEIIRYLRKDVESLHELVMAFIDRFGLQLTLASTAFKEIRKTGYEITRTSEQYDTQFRPFYFGGRVQCFKAGSFEGPLAFVDINSAYPYAMVHNHWYGSGFVEHLRLPDGDNGSWFAEISASSTGCLPVRADKLYFPDDGKERTYCASGWEINAGLETGTLRIKKVHRVYKPNLKNNFREYIEANFKDKDDFKQKGLHIKENKIGYIFAKLLMNSGYGKFAQDGRDFKKFCIVPFGEWPEAVDGAEPWQWYSDHENYSFFYRDDPDHRFFNVATAASITGFVRAYLWKAICAAEEPLYCDTDSLICRKFNGPMGKKLGEWDLEAELTEAHIAGRKMYAVKKTDGGYKVASKGVRLTFDEIKNGIKTGETIIHKKESPAMSIRFGQRYNPRKINFENIAKNTCQNF